MKTSSLSRFAEKNGQALAANVLGVSVAAISKAIIEERKITITEHEDGRVTAFETRPYPARKKKPS